MKRPTLKSLYRNFYIPKSAKPDSGITDHYGRVYMVLPSGAIKKIKDVQPGRKAK